MVPTSTPTVNNMREELKKWYDERSSYIHSLLNNVKNHSDYQICQETVDSLYSSSDYETGMVIGISSNREGFDEIYDMKYDSYFRGGCMEIKVGDNYVIYGFDFD